MATMMQRRLNDPVKRSTGSLPDCSAGPPSLARKSQLSQASNSCSDPGQPPPPGNYLIPTIIIMILGAQPPCHTLNIRSSRGAEEPLTESSSIKSPGNLANRSAIVHSPQLIIWECYCIHLQAKTDHRSNPGDRLLQSPSPVQREVKQPGHALTRVSFLEGH